MNLTNIIREIARGKEGARDLPADEATRLYGALLDGQVGELESGAIAIALRMKGESEAELAAFMAAIDVRLPALAMPAGALSGRGADLQWRASGCQSDALVDAGLA